MSNFLYFRKESLHLIEPCKKVHYLLLLTSTKLTIFLSGGCLRRWVGLSFFQFHYVSCFCPLNTPADYNKSPYFPLHWKIRTAFNFELNYNYELVSTPKSIHYEDKIHIQILVKKMVSINSSSSCPWLAPSFSWIFKFYHHVCFFFSPLYFWDIVLLNISILSICPPSSLFMQRFSSFSCIAKRFFFLNVHFLKYIIRLGQDYFDHIDLTSI